MVQTFQFIVTDDRKRNATLLIVEVAGEVRAKEYATAFVRRSGHYRRVEVYLDERRIFVAYPSKALALTDRRPAP